MSKESDDYMKDVVHGTVGKSKPPASPAESNADRQEKFAEQPMSQGQRPELSVPDRTPAVSAPTQPGDAVALLREIYDKGYIKHKHTNDETDLEERVQAYLSSATAGVQEAVTFNLAQARALVDMFGGDDSSIVVRHFPQSKDAESGDDMPAHTRGPISREQVEKWKADPETAMGSEYGALTYDSFAALCDLALQSLCARGDCPLPDGRTTSQAIIQSDFSKLPMQQLKELLSKNDVWGSLANSARFRTIRGGKAFCSVCGEAKERIADLVPPYQVCEPCFAQGKSAAPTQPGDAVALLWEAAHELDCESDLKLTRIRRDDLIDRIDAHLSSAKSAGPREAALQFADGKISAGKFGELLGLLPGELHDFKNACHAFDEQSAGAQEPLFHTASHGDADDVVTHLYWQDADDRTKEWYDTPLYALRKMP